MLEYVLFHMDGEGNWGESLEYINGQRGKVGFVEELVKGGVVLAKHRDKFIGVEYLCMIQSVPMPSNIRLQWKTSVFLMSIGHLALLSSTC